MGEIEETAIRSPAYEGAHEERRVHRKLSWGRMIVYTIFVLIGQSTATLLGRLYFNGGGKTILFAGLLQTIGFPILIPFAVYLSRKDSQKRANDQPPNLIRLLVCIFLGSIQAMGGILLAIGLQNLAVSSYSLISASQLCFNAFFSFVFNKQNLIPPILNSLVILTISSTLLIFQNSSESSSKNPKTGHFLVGFLCTLIGSALYALMLSLTQLAFQKMLKSEAFSTVVNMIICQSLVASFVVSMALFMTGDWRACRNEMGMFVYGRVLYVVIVVIVAACWQVYSIGAVGLIFEVSSLFSNVIITLGLPIVPILGAIFLHESIDGIKMISIVLAVWGFISYVYNQYLVDGTKKLHDHEILL